MKSKFKLFKAKENEWLVQSYCHFGNLFSKENLKNYPLQIVDKFSYALMINKDGSLQITMKLSPLSDNGNRETIAIRMREFNEALMSLKSGTTIHYEIQNINKKAQWLTDDSENMKGRCKEIEKIRYDYFSNLPYFEKNIFITISKSKEKNEDLESQINSFYGIVTAFEMEMASCDLQPEILKDSELLTYLHSCVSSDNREISSIKEMNGKDGIDELLCDSPCDQLTEELKLGDKFYGIISLDGMPKKMTGDEWSSILSINANFRLCVRFQALSEIEAQKKLEIIENRFDTLKISLRERLFRGDNADEDAPQNMAALEGMTESQEAREEIATKVCNYGYYSGCIIVEEEDLKELNKKITEIQNAFIQLGYIPRKEWANAFSVFCGAMPGNTVSNSRKILLSTLNITAMIHLSLPFTGKIENKFLGRITGSFKPHLYGLTEFYSPYYLNLNGGNDDVGHTFITGPTGSGKSFLLSLLAQGWMKYPEARVVIFDKGKSSYPLCKNSGGKIFEPGSDKTVRFAPFFNPSKRLYEIKNFVNSLIESNDLNLSNEEKAQSEKAISVLPKENASLESYQLALKGINQNHPLVHSMKNYLEENARGRIFAGKEDDFKIDNSITVIETETLMGMGESYILPSLTYMFGRLEEFFKDMKPTLLLLDECWSFFNHPVFADYIVQFLKTLRKRNVFVVMATQNIADLDVDQRVLHTVLTSCHTRIFLADPSANNTVVNEKYKSLGLKDYQVDIIRRIRRKQHYYVMQNEGESVVDFCMTSHSSLFQNEKEGKV